jgi:hypothetical protein
MDIVELEAYLQATCLPNNVCIMPFPILKEPQEKKSCLSFITPFQKDEPVRLAYKCASILEWRYLLCINYCHTPSSFKRLNNQLPSKHLFLITNTSTPRPPWSLGEKNVPLSQSVLSFVVIILPK